VVNGAKPDAIKRYFWEITRDQPFILQLKEMPSNADSEIVKVGARWRCGGLARPFLGVVSL
jgi:hypothetical protein